MQCLRCSSQTVEVQNKNISIDLCHAGCGGMWFDWMELKKMDEKHEVDEEFLHFIAQGSYKKIDLSHSLNCPKCIPTHPLMRRYTSVMRQVEIDECPHCGGIWLDAGELTHILTEFSTEQQRTEAAQKYIKEVFGEQMKSVSENNREKYSTFDKVTKVLRLITPSYYLKK